MRVMQSLLASLLLWSLIAGPLKAQKQASDKPNIVHIIADDLGWNDVGFHGSEIQTPAIDQLASESLVLDRFYVTPICSPTRAGVLTGRYPFRFGIWGSVVSPTKRHGLPPDEITIPEVLAECGYRHRGMLGKWHLGHASTKFHPLRHGFTSFYGHYNGAIDYFSRLRYGQLDWHRDYDAEIELGYSTELVGDEAVRFITQQAATDSPFYLTIAFNAPHSPLQALEQDLDAYGFDPSQPLGKHTVENLAKRESAPEYGLAGRGNNKRQTFAAMTSALDRNVGKILKAIDQSGQRDNTILVFHSDNGGIPTHGGSNKPLRGDKFTTWEGGTRVVSLIRWPTAIRPGVYNGVACYLDWKATFAAAAGSEGKLETDGKNMLPHFCAGTIDTGRQLALGDDTLLTQQWKLKGAELYDVEADPHESQNVAAQHPEVVEELGRALQEFASMKGLQCESDLPKPSQWPPAAWKIPEED